MHTDPATDYEQGFVPFLDCTIYLDSRPLIPRMETEYWVEKVIRKWSVDSGQRTGKELRVLDLFSGSGCIGVALLKHMPHTAVDFGELEERHIPTIMKNIRENGIDAPRAHVIVTDVFSNIRGTYNVIVANPPYVSHLSNVLEKSVAEHEPHEAVFADDDGFDFIERTIEGAKLHLEAGGELWIEHDPEQAERLSQCGERAGFSTQTHRDQFNRLRYTILSIAHH